ncbi:carbohydrate kinase family protein [Aeromicrobium ginsengisoli]|nr:carbohydrate kinase [Aeromicrobium ginsengisoli]
MNASPPTTAGDQPTILVVGEALVDVVVRHDGSRSEHRGGSPANVAVGLGRLGHPVTLATSLGDDPHGRMIDAELTASGVALAPGLFNDRPTSTATAWLDSRGSARYDFDIVWEPRSLDVLPKASFVHAGSIAAFLEPGADAVEALIGSVAASTIVTFDPNIRPRLLPDRAAVLARMDRLLPRCDVVKVSDEDLDWLHPGVPPTEVARRWISLGVRLVVLTAGARGSFAVHEAGEVQVASSVTQVVDTIGAGDAYMSGLLDAFVAGALTGREPSESVRNLTLAQVRICMQHANTSAAITVGRMGSEPPLRHELPSLIPAKV